MSDLVLLLSESTGKLIRARATQEPVEVGDYCLVESEYGGDLAMVIDTGSEVVQCPKVAKEAIKIIRRATQEDLDKFQWLREKEKHVKGKCAKCSYKSLCSGCRIRARAAYGDLWAEDPACYLSEEEIRSR